MELFVRLLGYALSPGGRPVLVAVLAVLLCLLLMRQRPKPRAPASTRAGETGATARTSRPTTCISTPGIVIDFSAPGGRPRFLPGAAEALRRLATAADVYLVTQLPVDSDELEGATLELLSSANLFSSGACDRRKAIFCATESGRSAIVRQLAPNVHLDTSPVVLTYLAPHVTRVVSVSEAKTPVPCPSGRVVCVGSLHDYAPH